MSNWVELARKGHGPLIAHAQTLGASDLHLGPGPGSYSLRLRCAGHLSVPHPLPPELGRSLVQALKAASKMNLAESRKPQDGRLSMPGLELRLATHPGLHGEHMVLRLLYAQERRSLAELALHPLVEARLRHLVQPEHGLTLVVGATGSGKTTTLHALLAELGQNAGCIATLEDPVEIVCPGALQTDLSQLPQLGFAQGLRSLMRQDPDTLLIGEVRDAETAHLMVHAALTGHRVLASLHAPDCLGALYRLLELGVNWLSLLNGLNGLVAQRLQPVDGPAASECSQALGASAIPSPAANSGFSAKVRPWAEVLDLLALGRRHVLAWPNPQALLGDLTPACYQPFVCREVS